jgi:hypothetical protein
LLPGADHGHVQQLGGRRRLRRQQAADARRRSREHHRRLVPDDHARTGQAPEAAAADDEALATVLRRAPGEQIEGDHGSVIGLDGPQHLDLVVELVDCDQGTARTRHDVQRSRDGQHRQHGRDVPSIGSEPHPRGPPVPLLEDELAAHLAAEGLGAVLGQPVLAGR